MHMSPPTGVEDNVAVMVSYARIRPIVDKMVLYIEGQSAATQYPMEEDAIRTIIFECLNEYVQFALPKIPQPQDLNFEYYLDTRFKAMADIINPPVTDENPYPNKAGILFLSAQWAMAVGELARQLIPGIRDLNAWGQDCNQMQVFTIPEAVSFDRAEDLRRTKVTSAMYILSGVQYDEVDMVEEGI
uniref:Uncharacterized protein n=1 Tax=Pseudomonas phage RVTF4 TaxID=3236931 RepID=A0AB39CCM4_9VIRU